MVEQYIIMIAWACNVPSLLIVWLLARYGAPPAVLTVFGAVLGVNLAMMLSQVAVPRWLPQPRWGSKWYMPSIYVMQFTGLVTIFGSWLSAGVIGAYGFAELMAVWQSWRWGWVFGVGIPFALVLIPLAIFATAYTLLTVAAAVYYKCRRMAVPPREVA